MNQVWKLVYVKTETSLEIEYALFKNNLVMKKYSKFISHTEKNWESKKGMGSMLQRQQSYERN